MVEVPAVTPVTTPVVAFTVATAVLEEVHVPPVVPLLANVEVPPIQMAGVPDKVPAETGAVTVTTKVDSALGQPPVPVTVYLIVEVPAVTPVTTPVVAFTVATAVLEEVPVPPVVPLLEIVEVPPIQMACVPDKVPAFTGAVTVTTLVLESLGQPPVPITE